MTEIIKQGKGKDHKDEIETPSPDETVNIKVDEFALFVLKDRRKHMILQQVRYRAMHSIQKINMRYLFFVGIWVAIVSVLLMFNIINIVANQDVLAMFMGVINVLTLFILAVGIEEALHWWDEEEERSGGYLADTETD